MAQTDILEYLRKTPHNTNVNVVKTMLDNSGGDGSESSLSNVLVLTEELHSSGDYYLLKKQDGTNFTEDDVNIDSAPTLELVLIRSFRVGATFEYRWYRASHIDAEGLVFVYGENQLEYFIGKQGEWLRTTEIA